jgi:hypothetical protein
VGRARLVTYIDEPAIATLTQLHRDLFPAGGEVLDLMSSWVNHLPPEVEYGRVIGLGMNEEELRRNPRLDAYTVQNLNTNPRLPFGSGEFNGAGICVSILQHFSNNAGRNVRGREGATLQQTTLKGALQAFVISAGGVPFVCWLKCCKQLSPAQDRACLRSVRVETIGRSLEECNPGICVVRI